MAEIVLTPVVKDPCHKLMPSFAQRGRQCESPVKMQIGADGLNYGYICVRYPEIHKKTHSKGVKV